MDEEIKEIINRQQEYEYLKHASVDDTFFVQYKNRKQSTLRDEFLTTAVLPRVENVYMKQRRRKFWKKAAKVIFLVFITVWVVLYSIGLAEIADAAVLARQMMTLI